MFARLRAMATVEGAHMLALRADRRHRVAIGLVLAALTGLAGCKEQKSAGATETSADAVRQAAEQDIRVGIPAATQVTFRGERVYAQAIPQHFAVCGQVNPFPDDTRIYVPFVSIVTTTGGDASGAPHYKFEHYIGLTTAEASRVYLAIVNYCYDKGGPGSGPMRSVMPMAPLPNSLPDPSVRPPSAASDAPAAPSTAPAGTTPGIAGSTSATGSVTMRQAANLHSDPHGPTLRVVPGGTVLKVFATATGGWYQVGDTAPWGWVHESMLEKH